MSEIGIGLMSGTSLDGVDAAQVAIPGRGEVELLAFDTTPYEPAFRSRILRAIHEGGAADLARLHVDLGSRFADAAACSVARTGIPVDFVASHGQTVWHEPGRVSWQIGDPAVIAERLGVPVVDDFRSRDVAAGGQGAPLVPIADVELFGHPERGRALLNLGGMANVTRVARRGEHEGAIAFDTGPGVAVIDAVVRRLVPDRAFDEDGRLARAGQPVGPILDALLGDPWFSKSPPRSTGRETFGEEYADALVTRCYEARPQVTVEDLVATATALTVRSVADAVARWIPDATEVVVSGGGARNPALLSGLRAGFRDRTTVLRFDDLFFDGDAKEAVAFAYLGWLTRRGLPGNVPSATGAAGPRVLGRITPG